MIGMEVGEENAVDLAHGHTPQADIARDPIAGIERSKFLSLAMTYSGRNSKN
jgi:hypothetical protein